MSIARTLFKYTSLVIGVPTAFAVGAVCGGLALNFVPGVFKKTPPSGQPGFPVMNFLADLHVLGVVVCAIFCAAQDIYKLYCYLDNKWFATEDEKLIFYTNGKLSATTHGE